VEEGAPRKNVFVRGAEKLVASRGGAWFYIHVAPHIDRRLLPLTRGHLSFSGMHRVGLLKVKGAKSGVERTTPLVYTADGDRFVLVASRGGGARHPAWYHNCVANPDVSFLGPGGWRQCRAHVAEGAERERLWPKVVARYSGYETYRERAAAEREIPLVVLEPQDGVVAGGAQR
jgi:deazaflavin-dependent oxidoreductase (nitroreductase family)